MRKLIDMNRKSEIGFIDWEFIHDMQGIVPDLINPEVIHLNHEFLDQIPKKWNKIKAKLAKHVRGKETVHAAIADVENLGNEFKIRGTLHDKKGQILPFHKVVVFDEDRFEDDCIGTVISDEEGKFELAFGKATFSDFGLEAEPDIYLKIFYWKDGRFHDLARVMPEIYEKSETREGKKIIEFGVIEV